LGTVQRIARNTTALLAGQVLSYILAFFYMMYIARYLGPASFGILSFAFAFTSIFAIFSNLGLDVLTVRQVARDKSLAMKYLANVSLMKMILAAIICGLIVLTINLLGYPEETIKVVYILTLYVICQSFTHMLYSMFQAFERMEFMAIGGVLNAILLLCGTMFAINYGFAVAGFASIYVIASIIVLGYSFIVIRLKFTNQTLASFKKAFIFDRTFWRPTIREAFPFGLTGMFGVIYTYIDSVMLSAMQGATVVGYYNAAYKLVLVLLFIPSTAGIAIFPSMSRYYSILKGTIKLAIEKFCKYMLILGIPIGIGTTLLANKIIFLVFGSEYLHSIIALQILIWTVVLTFAGAPFVKLLESANRQAIVARISGICMVANIVLNLLLIPEYSYVGASIATVITEIILVGSIIIVTHRIGYGIPHKRLIKYVLKVAIASLVMGVFIWYFEYLQIYLILPLAVLIYFGIFYIIKGFDKEDILLFKRLISSRGN